MASGLSVNEVSGRGGRYGAALKELYLGLYPEERRRLRSFKLPEVGSATFVAEYGSEPIGFALLTYTSYKSEGTGFGYIEELFVRKKHRGLGAGRALVNACIGWCERRGYNVIFLTTPKTNAGAIRFYRKLGFRKNRQVWLQYVNKAKRK